MTATSIFQVLQEVRQGNSKRQRAALRIRVLQRAVHAEYTVCCYIYGHAHSRFVERILGTF